MEQGNFTPEVEADEWKPEQIFNEQYNIDAFVRLNTELTAVNAVREGEKLLARQQNNKNTEVEVNFSDPSEALMNREQKVYAVFAPSNNSLLETPELILEELYARDIYIALVKSTLKALNDGNSQQYPRLILEASNDLYLLLKIVNQPVVEYKDLILDPYKKQKPFNSQFSAICQKYPSLPRDLDKKILNATFIGAKNAPKTLAPKLSRKQESIPNVTPPEGKQNELMNDTLLSQEFEPENNVVHFLRFFKSDATTENKKIDSLAHDVTMGNIENILYIKNEDNRWFRGLVGIKAYFEKLDQNNDHEFIQLMLNKLNNNSANEIEIIKISNMFTEISNKSAKTEAEKIQPLLLVQTHMPKAFERVRYVMQKLGLEEDNKTAKQLGDIVQAVLSIGMSKPKNQNNSRMTK